MRELAALGRTGRPGRVHDRGHVLRPEALRRGSGGGIPGRGAALPEVAQGRDAGRGHHGHDVLEHGQVVANPLDLRQLLRILDDGDPHVGMREHIAALLGRARLVDGHDDGAGAQRAEVRERPLGPRVPDHRDAVAAAHAQLDQAGGQLERGARDVGEARVGPRLPFADAQRHAVVSGGSERELRE